MFNKIRHQIFWDFEIKMNHSISTRRPKPNCRKKKKEKEKRKKRIY